MTTFLDETAPLVVWSDVDETADKLQETTDKFNIRTKEWIKELNKQKWVKVQPIQDIFHRFHYSQVSES